MDLASDSQFLQHGVYLRDIKAVCKLAGVEGAHIHPHAFRHCFAVHFRVSAQLRTTLSRGVDVWSDSNIRNCCPSRDTS